MNCSFADISIYDAILDKSSEDLKISVANTGTKDLSNLSLSVIYEDGNRKHQFLSLYRLEISSISIYMLVMRI